MEITSLILLQIITCVLNLISILLCLVAVTVYLVIRRNRQEALANRISFRLAFNFIVADTFYSLFGILAVQTNLNQIYCEVSIWGFLFFSLYSLLILVMISFNLHLVLFNQSRHYEKNDRLYQITGICFALSVTGLCVFLNGKNTEQAAPSCWVIIGQTSGEGVWTWLLLFGCLICFILYCFVVAGVAFALISKKTKLNLAAFPTTNNNNNNNEANRWSLAKTINRKSMTFEALETIDEDKLTQRQELQLKWHKLLQQVLQRIIIYPSLLTLTRVPLFVIFTYCFAMGKVDYMLIMLGLMMSSIEGAFAAIIFLTEPTVKEQLRQVFNTSNQTMEEKKPREKPILPIEIRNSIAVIKKNHQLNLIELDLETGDFIMEMEQTLARL